MNAICSKCSKPRQAFFGSKLTTHAGCHFSPEVQEEIRLQWELPSVSVKMLAEKYGVSIGVIRASVHAARLRRGLPGLR